MPDELLLGGGEPVRCACCWLWCAGFRMFLGDSSAHRTGGLRAPGSEGTCSMLAQCAALLLLVRRFTIILAVA